MTAKRDGFFPSGEENVLELDSTDSYTFVNTLMTTELYTLYG